jgi:hypothetical protein
MLADDHAIVRGGLKGLLLRHLEGVECGEVENAEQVLAQVRQQRWDLLILDITMPGRSGLDILVDLKLLRPAGGRYVSPTLAEKFVRDLQGTGTNCLTRRSARKVAGSLRDVGPGTTRIRQKLGKNRVVTSQHPRAISYVWCGTGQTRPVSAFPRASRRLEAAANQRTGVLRHYRQMQAIDVHTNAPALVHKRTILRDNKKRRLLASAGHSVCFPPILTHL